jgi:hypothetical protein
MSTEMSQSTRFFIGTFWFLGKDSYTPPFFLSTLGSRLGKLLPRFTERFVVSIKFSFFYGIRLTIKRLGEMLF